MWLGSKLGYSAVTLRSLCIACIFVRWQLLFCMLCRFVFDVTNQLKDLFCLGLNKFITNFSVQRRA